MMGWAFEEGSFKNPYMYLKEIESVSSMHFHEKTLRKKDAKNEFFFTTYAPLRLCVELNSL
jgi:hypothetical protein